MSNWALATLVRKSAPNFGGMESWWEATLSHQDGRTAFGAGRTEGDAVRNAEAQAVNQDADRASIVEPDPDSEIPF